MSAPAVQREVAEMALAHVITNKVEAAYRRGSMLEKRRRLMAQWARFCIEPEFLASVIGTPVVAVR